MGGVVLNMKSTLFAMYYSLPHWEYVLLGDGGVEYYGEGISSRQQDPNHNMCSALAAHRCLLTPGHWTRSETLWNIALYKVLSRFTLVSTRASES